MRTQYMRVAFQIPFDATVRVSLDTNLCMISERTKETINGECIVHSIFVWDLICIAIIHYVKLIIENSFFFN
jgi:SPX domain protein involved in polyphosphate accumulation